MLTPEATLPRRRPGFSLVVALMVMTLLVLTILTATAFLKVESTLAMTKQTEACSRFAALAALRLAQAALQERLGPDTRVSAPAVSSVRGCVKRRRRLRRRSYLPPPSTGLRTGFDTARYRSPAQGERG